MLDFRKVATAQAWAALVWGIVLLAIPGMVLDMLGVHADAAHLLLGRLAGGMLFALGVTLFIARDTREPDARTRVAFGNATCDLAMLIVFATSAIGGVIGPVGYVVAIAFGANVGLWVGTRVGARDPVS